MLGLESWDGNLSATIGWILFGVMVLIVVRFWIGPEDFEGAKKFAATSFGAFLLLVIITVVAGWLGSPFVELCCGLWIILWFAADFPFETKERF